MCIRDRSALAAGVLGLAVFGVPGYAQSSPPVGDDSVRPFHISIPEEQLVELRQRIAATRWPDKETVNDESQGIRLAEMQALVRYWGNGYNWRNGEAVSYTHLDVYKRQTKWFVLFCVAATACLAWMAYRYRVRQVTGRLDMQFKERLSERTRIARELHDTLLQSFQGLTLHFQRARNLLPDRAAEAIQTLDKALDGAEQAIVEGRDAIHDLRSLAPAAQGLAEEITALGEELIAEDTNKDPAQFRCV